MLIYIPFFNTDSVLNSLINVTRKEANLKTYKQSYVTEVDYLKNSNWVD
jgi:hypothetical protein